MNESRTRERDLDFEGVVHIPTRVSSGSAFGDRQDVAYVLIRVHTTRYGLMD